MMGGGEIDGELRNEADGLFTCEPDLEETRTGPVGMNGDRESRVEGHPEFGRRCERDEMYIVYWEHDGSSGR